MYAGNDPIKNIDVNGDSLTENAWKWMNKLLRYQQNKINKLETKLSNTKSALSGNLSDKDRKRKFKKYNKLKGKIKDANSVFNQLNVEYIALDESDQIYDVQMSNSLGGGTSNSVLGNVSFDKKTDIFIIHLLSGQGNLGQAAHEFKHAYQFETGDLAFVPSGKAAASRYLWDIFNERDANEWSAHFGSKTMTPETGSKTRQTIYNNIGNLELYKRLHLIFRYNGKTYK